MPCKSSLPHRSEANAYGPACDASAAAAADECSASPGLTNGFNSGLPNVLGNSGLPNASLNNGLLYTISSTPGSVVISGMPSAGHRNKDGLLVPCTRSFGIMLAIYKIMLIVECITLMLLMSLTTLFTTGADWLMSHSSDRLQASTFVTRTTEEEEDRMLMTIDMFHTLLPFLLIAFPISLLHIVFGWMSVSTLRLSYLRVDLVLMMAFTVLWLMTTLSTDVFDAIDAIGLISAQVAELALISFIYFDIRRLNET